MSPITFPPLLTPHGRYRGELRTKGVVEEKEEEEEGPAPIGGGISLFSQ